MEWIQSHDGLKVLLDPSEDDAVGEDGKPLSKKFMPEVQRFDPANLAKQADFIICLGGDGEGMVCGFPLQNVFRFGSHCFPFLRRVSRASRFLIFTEKKQNGTDFDVFFFR